VKIDILFFLIGARIWAKVHRTRLVAWLLLCFGG